MVYKLFSPRTGRFDKMLFAGAVVVLAAALLSQPKEIFRLSGTELRFAQSWFNDDDTALATFIGGFHEHNSGIAVVLSESAPDIVAFDALSEWGTTPSATGEDAEDAGSAEGLAFEEEREIVSFINMFFYNITLLEECGFDRPPKTREEYLAYAQEVKKTLKGVEGAARGGDVFLDITPWLWAGFLSPVQEDKGGAPKIDWTSRAAIDTMSFLKQLYDAGLVDEASFTTGSAPARQRALENFTQGKSVFFMGTAADARVIRRNAPDLHFSVTSIPTPAGHPVPSVFNTNYWKLGIRRDCEDIEAARRFVDFIENERDAIANTVNAIGAGGAYGDTSELDYKIKSLAQSSSIVRDSALFPSTRDAVLVLHTELGKLWRSEQSPRETAQALERAFTQS